MAQYQVPQFIEAEDKIVGPLTLKQFLYIGAGAAVIFLTFFILKFFLWLILASVVAILSLAMAFVKYNGRPLPKIMVSAFQYFWSPRMYTWQREDTKIEVPDVKIPKMPQAPTPIKVVPREEIEEKPPVPLKKLKLKLSTSNEAATVQPNAEKGRHDLFQIFRKTTGERDVARRIDYR
ncbi:MAG: PrgI family protein [bacterium]|nr:PrgI family protein [bacterium]